MDDVLAAYQAVYGASAPIENLPMSGDGVVLRNQQLWAEAEQAARPPVTAWVQGNTVTVSGPPGTTVPSRSRPGRGWDRGRPGLRQPVRRRAVRVHATRIAAAQDRSRLGGRLKPGPGQPGGAAPASSASGGAPASRRGRVSRGPRRDARPAQQSGLRMMGPVNAPSVPGPTEPYWASPPNVLPLRMLPNSHTHDLATRAWVKYG